MHLYQSHEVSKTMLGTQRALGESASGLSDIM